MINIFDIFIILENIIIGISLLLTSIFAIIILSFQRFQHHNHLLIVNICFAIIPSAIFFCFFFNMNYFGTRNLYVSNLCVYVFFAYAIAAIKVQLSFVTFSIHRAFAIVYHTTPFFKRKWWLTICIASQLLIECIIGLPFVVRNQPVSNTSDMCCYHRR
jgi:hypothetical protein